MNEFPLIPLSEGQDDAGAVVICVPGAMCSPEVFKEMAGMTGLRTYGVAWLEGPGPHDIESVAERLARTVTQFRQVILVGHSIGVPIVTLAAGRLLEKAPGVLRALLLSNSGATTTGHGDIDTIIRRIRTEWGTPFWTQFMDRCIEVRLPQPLMQACLTYPSRLASEAVAQAVESQKQIDLRPTLESINGVRTAVVHGKFDKARSLAHASELAQHLRGSRLFVFDTGHTTPAEAPRAFADVLKSIS